MKEELSDFRASSTFTEGVLEQKLENVEKHLDTLEEKIQNVYDYQEDYDYTNYIQDKLIDLEDRSRRNNM